MPNIPNADTTTLKGVVIPEIFAPPSWVEPTFEKFRSLVKTDYNKNKCLNNNLVKGAIKEIILDNKVSPPFPLDNKNIKKLLEKMYAAYGDEEFQWRYYLIYRIGFFLSTFAGVSFTPEALQLPQKFRKPRQDIIDKYESMIQEATKDVDRDAAILWVDKSFDKLTKDVLEYFRENSDQYPIIQSIDSGAKGGRDDLRKLLVAIGLSINAKGEINDVISRSGSEGLTPTQFFNYSSQAIVSQYKKSTDTAIPGYLIRQLNSIASGVNLSYMQDCGTKRYLSIKIMNKEMLQSMAGKLLHNDSAISPSDTDLIDTTVKLRSPLYCQAKDGICHKCYNPSFIEKMHLKDNTGIGLLASTAQAGMLTNLTLKAAHTGLSLDKEETNLIEDIKEFSE